MNRPIDKAALHAFLLNARYGKFNLWPRATNEAVADFLAGDVNRIENDGMVFAAGGADKITALLAVEALEWDTRHLGYKCAKIEYLLADQTQGPEGMRQSLGRVLAEFREYCAGCHVKFAYAAVEGGDPAANWALQEAGFRYVLTWLDGVFQSSNRIPEIAADAEVGPIQREELDYFAELSSRCYFKGGRFYLDGHFDRGQADAVYAALVRSSYDSRCIMLAYRVEGKPQALFICRNIATYGAFGDLRVAPLRYLVVDPRFRNRDVAYRLFIKTLEHLKDKSDLVTTGLEAHNMASLNLHVKVGFRFNCSCNTYHWWDEPS
jgi:GNAT superfamily N-acetyltransferase/mono/diheme cytochrome c family protein